MDVLKEKNFKDYNYTCRYTSVPYYFNTADGKYMYGLCTQMNTTTSYQAHKVLSTDTLDSLALKYYGNPTYYWVIAGFNNITDCYRPLIEYFDIIKIPNISSITFEENN